MKNYSTVKTHFETILIKHATSHCEITLNLEKVQITETYEDQYYIGFVGTSTSNEGFCRKCGQVLTRFKQYKTTYTTIARFNDKNVVLKLRKKMYHCPDCRSSTTERLIKQSGSNQKTDSFLASMIGCLKETVSYSAVARLYKVSVSNLIRHFDKTHLAETRVDRKAVRNISVDEVRLVKQRHSNYQFDIMDSDTRQVLDILKSRQSSDIQHYLRAHYEGILTFTQDLWRPYRTVALNLFQGVKVVADKFHVVRQFMWAFSRARISLAKAKNKGTCRFWKILTKTRQKLDDRGKIRLEQLLAEDPELRVLHEAKEMALSLFRCKDSESYLRLLPAFKAAIEQDGLEEFRKAYKSLVS